MVTKEKIFSAIAEKLEGTSAYKYIRCDVLGEEDRFWRLEVWETDDPKEVGKEAAYIDDLTGRVVYLIPKAETDPGVAIEVARKLDEIQAKKVLVTHYRGNPVLQLKTDAGVMSAMAETKDNTNHDSIFIGIDFPSKSPNAEYKDLAAVKEEDGNLAIYAFQDISDGDGDFTDRSVVWKEEIQDLVNFWEALDRDEASGGEDDSIFNTPEKKRCRDCMYLIDDDGKWICDDCGKNIHDIPDDECSANQEW